MRRVTPLCTEKIGPNLWILTAPLVFVYTTEARNTRTYTIPKGFITDGASTPRFLWSICPPMGGRTAEAAVLHDWFYSKTCSITATRPYADEMFLAAMIANGVSWRRRQAVYRGVRIGGWASFRKLYCTEKSLGDAVY